LIRVIGPVGKLSRIGGDEFIAYIDCCRSKTEMELIAVSILEHFSEPFVDELVLHYQPQINLLTNEIIGAEALLRWNSPELGMIPPGIFIPLAEKHGLINKIGMWVLRSVCEQIKLWEQNGISPIMVGINVSIEQLKEAGFVEEVRGVIKEFEIKTELLEFEITESIIASEMYDVIEKLHQFRNMGIHISIDDFGSEYSSLRRLKDLPIDRIKVDREFIRNISRDGKNRTILKAIIELAKLLGLEVIIEGVETKEELIIVKELKCEEAQGFYYYCPMPAPELEKLLLPQ
jgi:EAL domain-containing protein (putative c-di-GMP-specific phosphodiesterase class I)